MTTIYTGITDTKALRQWLETPKIKELCDTVSWTTPCEIRDQVRCLVRIALALLHEVDCFGLVFAYACAM